MRHNLKEGVTATMTTRKRYLNLTNSLGGFFNHNTYPLERFVVINDGEFTAGLSEVMKIFSNCTWIVSGEHVGQVLALDMAYSLVETEWLYHCEDDYLYLDSGFIEE